MVAISLLIEYNKNSDSKLLYEALKVIDCLKNTFYTYGYFPRPEHSNFKYGWVSAMDAPTIALSAQMAWEITKDEEYKKFRDDLIDYCKKNTKKHGFILMENDGGVWPLEYAYVDTDECDAEYVYNGSLFGYQALEMLATVVDDKELNGLLDMFIANYKKKSKNYLYADKNWCYYMLNPKVINNTPKIVIELHALDALKFLMPSECFWLNEAEIRRNILGKNYTVECFDDNGINKILFWRSAGPHPYMTDCYRSCIEIYDDNNNLLDTFYKDGRDYSNSWLVEDCSVRASYAKVYAMPLKNEFEECFKTLLCEVKIDNASSIDLMDDIKYKKKENKYNIENIKVCDYKLELDESINFDKPAIFGIEVNNNSQEDINVRLKFNDGDMDRYYTELKSGKNLILINTIGIRNSDDIINKNIKNINLMLFFDNCEGCENIIDIRKIINFKKKKDIYEYQLKSSYMVNYQI